MPKGPKQIRPRHRKIRAVVGRFRKVVWVRREGRKR